MYKVLEREYSQLGDIDEALATAAISKNLGYSDLP